MSLATLEASRKTAWRNHFDAQGSGAHSLAKSYKAAAEEITAERDAKVIGYRAMVSAARVPRADGAKYQGLHRAARDAALAELVTDAEIRIWAEHRADEAGVLATAAGNDLMMQTAAALTHWKRWDVPPPKLTGTRTPEGLMARLACPKQWRMAGRKAWAQCRELRNIKAGKVHRRAGLYVSAEMLQWRIGRAQDCRGLLERMVAVANDGEMIPLIDAVDASLSNPRIRRIDTMDWIGALDRLSFMRGDVALFETYTLASKFHPYTWKNKAVSRNAKWDGAGCPTPRDGQDRLAELWDGALRKLRKKGIKWYGMRTVQPHHDGTAHWHVLIFCQEADRLAIRTVMREQFLADDPDEAGAQKRRIVSRDIDRSKGSAVGYVARYIARAIDGTDCRDVSELDDDGVRRKTANDSITGAQRATAWASVWRIRMFQFFGIPSKLLARELRRVESCEDWFMERCRRAADEADFAEFIDLVGGPMTPRRERPLQSWRDPQARRNCYDEPRPDSIKGVQMSFEFFNPRPVIARPKPVQLIGFGIPGAPLPKALRADAWMQTLALHKKHKADTAERWEALAAAWMPEHRALSRPREWTLQIMPMPLTGETVQRIEAAWSRLTSSEGAAAAPWKTVNNCSALSPDDADFLAAFAALPPFSTAVDDPPTLDYLEYAL